MVIAFVFIALGYVGLGLAGWGLVYVGKGWGLAGRLACAVAGVGVAGLAVCLTFVLLIAIAAAGCPPDAYECPF
jgi:hypothetical protein